MNESEYLASSIVDGLIRHLMTTQQPERKARLFAIHCISEIQDLIEDRRSLDAYRYIYEKYELKSLRRSQGFRSARELANAASEEANQIHRVMGQDRNCPPDQWSIFERRKYVTDAIIFLFNIEKYYGMNSALIIAMSCERALQYDSYSRSKPPDWKGEPLRSNRQLEFLRDIFGNPFRPVAFDPAWRTSDSTGIAKKMYADRNFSAMPVLADALEEAGCDSVHILLHCRTPGTHVRGCWVVDLVLDKK
jgi:hypothetical protein